MHAERDIVLPILSVRPIAGIVSKRTDISSQFFNDLVGASLLFLSPLSGDVKYTAVGKICDFRQKSLFISDTVQDRPVVTMDQEVTGSRSIRVGSDDLE